MMRLLLQSHVQLGCSKPLVTWQRVVVAFFIVGVAGALPMQSQVNVLDSNPLAARRQYVYSLLGGFVGLANNLQGGSFTTACDCEFTGGAGTAITAGLVFERYTRSEITFGAALAYEARGVTSRFQEVEALMQTSPSTGRTYEVPVSFRNTAGVSLHMISLMPFVKYHVFKSLWLRGGPTVGVVVHHRIRHEKELLTTNVVLPGGEQASVRLRDVDGTTAVIEDAPIADLSALQLGVNGGVGLDIKFGKRFFLGPVVQYYHPLTTISGRGVSFSIRTVQVLVEGKFIL